MKQVSSHNVKVIFDTNHVLYCNEVPTDYVYKMAGHVHLSDEGRLLPGAGRGDFEGLIGALREIGYEGYVAMEIGFDSPEVEPDHDARQDYEYVKPLLDC